MEAEDEDEEDGDGEERDGERGGVEIVEMHQGQCIRALAIPFWGCTRLCCSCSILGPHQAAPRFGPHQAVHILGPYQPVPQLFFMPTLHAEPKLLQQTTEAISDGGKPFHLNSYLCNSCRRGAQHQVGAVHS